MGQATEKNVRAAIKHLEDEGKKVTVRAIYKLVGGNYNAIAELYRAVTEEITVAEQAPADILLLFTDLADDLYNKVRSKAEAAFSGERAGMKNQIDGLTSERDDAGEAVSELEAELAELKSTQAEDAAASTAEITRLRAERDQAVGKADALTQQVEALYKDHAKRLDETEAAHAAALTALKNDQLQTLADGEAKHAAALTDAKEGYSTALANNKASYTDALAAVEAKVTALQADLKARDAALAAVNNELTSTKSALTDVTRDRDAHAKSATAAQAALAEEKSTARDARQDVEKLSVQVESLRKAVEKLTPAKSAEIDSDEASNVTSMMKP
ncbi:replication region DNA-binding N-term [Sulfitobacter brevis]|uniref:Replication region DNA-binding N-term n=1 Tax=Sulfitobacter brevis TaxID=74348 RepID=A0A1I2GBY8_9RHOB|nr:DNA-binding protein [Sulfitobacter brevis]SFF14437.1 replication region DNA-binding N-term [Sulfitobacter brevis]